MYPVRCNLLWRQVKSEVRKLRETRVIELKECHRTWSLWFDGKSATILGSKILSKNSSKGLWDTVKGVLLNALWVVGSRYSLLSPGCARIQRLFYGNWRTFGSLVILGSLFWFLSAHNIGALDRSTWCTRKSLQDSFPLTKSHSLWCRWWVESERVVLWGLSWCWPHSMKAEQSVTSSVVCATAAFVCFQQLVDHHGREGMLGWWWSWTANSLLGRTNSRLYPWFYEPGQQQDELLLLLLLLSYYGLCCCRQWQWLWLFVFTFGAFSHVPFLTIAVSRPLSLCEARPTFHPGL